MLIAILVLSAMSLAVNTAFVALFMWAMVLDEKEKREARKRDFQKKEQED